MHPGVPAFCYITKTKLEFLNKTKKKAVKPLQKVHLMVLCNDDTAQLTPWNTSVLRAVTTTQHYRAATDGPFSIPDITSLDLIYKYALTRFTLFCTTKIRQRFNLRFKDEQFAALRWSWASTELVTTISSSFSRWFNLTHYQREQYALINKSFTKFLSIHIISSVCPLVCVGGCLSRWHSKGWQRWRGWLKSKISSDLCVTLK